MIPAPRGKWPRWILAIEMLVCFVPLTLLGVGVVGEALGGRMPAASAMLYLSVVATGPLGLVVSVRRLVGGVTPLGRGTVIVLCIAAGWTLLAYVLLPYNARSPISEWWREFVIIALLPSIGVVRLVLGNRGVSATP